MIRINLYGRALKEVVECRHDFLEESGKPSSLFEGVRLISEERMKVRVTVNMW